MIDEIDILTSDVATSKLGASRKRRLAVVTGTVIAFAVLTAPVWLTALGALLIVSGPLQEADAIVILAGDEDERLAHGAQLLERGYADWYVITNMHIETSNPQRSYAFIVRRKAMRLGVPEDRILTVPEIVATTYEEAVAIRAFTEQQGFRSLIVVTSPYHTRRARWIINEVFDGSGIAITVRPVEDHGYTAGSWWRSTAGWRFTTSEYAKLLAHLLGCKHSNCQ